jgi:hypothetical protein
VLWKPVSAIYGFHAGISGHGLLKLIQTDLEITKHGFGSIFRTIEAPMYRLGRRLIGPARMVGKALPVVGGLLSAGGLAQDIQAGDVGSGVGNALGVAEAGAALVGATSAAAVLGAGAAGYAVGTLINDHVLSESTKEAIGGTLNEIYESGWQNVKSFYFGK